MPKLLIVDDALPERVRVSGIASKWLDCDVMEADNGRKALDQIQSHIPDIVLTDLQMPEMDGLELVAAMKDDYPHIPVILMTAEGSEQTAAEALQKGAASYVPKLRLADDLVDTLHQVYTTSRVAHSQFRLMHYMTESALCFTLTNDTGLLQACVDQLVNMLRCLPLGDETERVRAGIAVQEALNNARYHGNLEIPPDIGDDAAALTKLIRQRSREEPWSHRKIHVRAEICRQRARFVIRDEGPGFDTSLANSVDSMTISGTGTRGRGITLMRSIMDEVHFNSAGNEVTLVRNAVQYTDEEDDDDE